MVGLSSISVASPAGSPARAAFPLPAQRRRGGCARWLAAMLAGLFLTLPVAVVEAACRNFVVAGKDASFLLLDGADWEISRVGNYWSVGVRDIAEVLPGSTHQRPGFKSGEFVDRSNREPIFGAAPTGRPVAAVMLKRSPEISLTDVGWPPHYYRLEETEGVRSPQWVHWLREDTLFRAFDVDSATAVYHMAASPLAEELETLNVWDIGDMDLSMPFCAVGETLYFTDGANALSVPAAGGPNNERRPLAALTEGGYELTPLHTKNCKALASRPSEDDSELIEFALYDIAADSVESEFAAPASARNLLFAEGSRWLRQLAQNPEAQDSAAEELVPSATFQLIDTATGEVLRETVLDVTGGALIEEMQCDADTPRAVIAGPRRIWLLDAETLTVVAENEIPFDRDYFVFE